MRLFQEKFLNNPDQVRELSERDFYKRKEAIWSGQLQRLQHDLSEARKQLVDYDKVQAEVEEAQKMIEEL